MKSQQKSSLDSNIMIYDLHYQSVIIVLTLIHDLRKDTLILFFWSESLVPSVDHFYSDPGAALAYYSSHDGRYLSTCY